MLSGNDFPIKNYLDTFIFNGVHAIAMSSPQERKADLFISDWM